MLQLTHDNVDWIKSVTDHRIMLLAEWTQEDPDDADMREELKHAESVFSKVEEAELDRASSKFPITLIDDEVAWIRAWFTRRLEEVDADLEEGPWGYGERNELAKERAFVLAVLLALPSHREEVIDE
jgi:glutathione S-transferase